MYSLPKIAKNIFTKIKKKWLFLAKNPVKWRFCSIYLRIFFNEEYGYGMVEIHTIKGN